MEKHSLYLVRHALAVERGDDWPDDTKRPLTKKGVARMREVTDGLAALDVELDVIITSPLVRARETAELLAAGWLSRPVMGVSTALAPGLQPAAVADMLSRHPKANGIALVGHEPGLGEFAAWLIGAAHPLLLKKGGVIRIDVPTIPPVPGSGHLAWAATPKMLRNISR